jgi:DNA phosphorothioation-dependent restriction protein DptG
MLASRLRAQKAIINEACSLIGRKCHVSRKIARYDFLPFLRIIFEEDSSLASKISHWLGFKDYMVEYFARASKASIGRELFSSGFRQKSL